MKLWLLLVVAWSVAAFGIVIFVRIWWSQTLPMLLLIVGGYVAVTIVAQRRGGRSRQG